tara:strand:- start:7664 stop:8950 length:1287 start_codon:yes stop_codon:yes gene_type:complete
MAKSNHEGAAPLRVLIVRGSFASLGGAERELLQLMRATYGRWTLGLATLKMTDDAETLLGTANVPVFHPATSITWHTGALSEVSARLSREAEKAWATVEIPWENYDAVHLSVCKGTLELLPHIPPHLPIHYHCLEPPRWLYEDVLHRQLNGKLKRPLWLTKLLFTRQRRRDRAYVRQLFARPKSSISGNSMWIQRRIKSVYGLSSDPTKENGEPPKRDAKGRPLEATHLMHVIDMKQWPLEPDSEEEKEVSGINLTEMPYVVTIGQISHVKGTWETLQSLVGTGLELVQVGGGTDEDRATLIQEGKRIGVPVHCMPRLSQPALCGLIRGAKAMVSHAHHEPFGLTPIEAMAVGTPALMVDEGGFQCTMTPVESGRLLRRDDEEAWNNAYASLEDESLRKQWAKSGRPYVEENFTLPVQIAALEQMLTR